MSNDNMKLILENWRSYSTMVASTDQVGSIFLFENNIPVKSDFSLMLEKYDNGNISKEQLMEVWNRSVLYEFDIASEGVLDTMKSGVETVKGWWHKAKDWVLEKAIQLYQIASRGIEAAVKGAQALIDKAAQFKSENPVAFKILLVVALAIAMFALMAALDSGTAQAAIKTTGAGGMVPGAGEAEGGVISDVAYEALRGMVHQAGELEGAGLELRSEAMNIIDTAQAAGDTVDLSQLSSEYGEFANSQLETLDGLYSLAQEGDPDALKWLKELVDVGKNVVYKIGGVPTR